MNTFNVEKRKKITLQKLEASLKRATYQDFFNEIMQLIEQKKLTPIKNSKLNGKKPALYLAYWIEPSEVDRSHLIDELRYQLNSRLKIDYYLQNLKIYEQDRLFILQLSAYLNENPSKMERNISLNERSYEIWQREKFLQQEGGRQLLKNLGLELSQLNIYHTAEPIAYYSRHKNQPQNILIIENKDTFYTLRKHLLAGHDSILGLPIGTLIYGGGKKVTKAFGDFHDSVEPYLLDKSNQFYYFGDIDYEGIAIYHQLQGVFSQVQPFLPAYSLMVKKAKAFNLAKMKSGQREQNTLLFLKHFQEDERLLIRSLLEKGHYIPQEIMNLSDL